jgi:hypothetical protein
MQVLLVHPPDTSPSGAARAALDRMAPPWDLVCLHAFLLARTGHVPHWVDTRLFSRFEADLDETLRRIAGPRLMVVHTRPLHLAEAMAVVETVHRRAPDVPLALCGPFPSAHPQQAISLPHVNYVLAGDPEPILRALLDSLHAPNRLRQIPGLYVRGSGGQGPAWLPDLAALPLPTWEGPPWNAYRTSVGGGVAAELRVSRGHTRSPADRAAGGADEPLRFWPFERLAPLLQKCAHKGATEVMIADPPGVWTPDRVRAWCHALVRAHNTHPWSFSCLPRQFSAAELSDLREAGCRRIEFILPSCDPAVLQRFECLHERRRLAAALRAVAHEGLQLMVRVWTGGPEERTGERDRIVRLLEAVHYPAFQPEPFPFSFDSPLARERAADAADLTLDAWMAWAREPWLQARPVPAWGGAAGDRAAGETCRYVVQRIAGSPRRRWQRWWSRWRSRSLIDEMESRMLALFQKPAPPGATPPDGA